MDEAIAVLKQQGAIDRRSRRHPERRRQGSEEQLPVVGHLLRRRTTRKGKDANCSVVLKYGMKRDFNAWLATLGAAAPVKTLTELSQWNTTHTRRPARSSTASRNSTSRTRWTSSRTARATRRTARKDITLGGDARHRRGDEGRPARRAAVPRRERRRNLAASPAIPTVIVPFALVPNAPTPRVPGRLRRRSRRRSASASPAWRAASRS